LVGQLMVGGLHGVMVKLTWPGTEVSME